MNKRARIMVAVCLILGAALVIWAVSTVPEAPEQLPQPEQKIMSYEGNTLSEEKDGRKLWDLTSEKIDVDVDTQDMHLTGITGHFYAEDGRTAELKAEGGIYNGKSKDVKLSGNIMVTYSDGAILTSKELEWKNEAEVLTATGDVKATREDVLITADQVEAREGFNKIKATGHAHIEKNEEKAKAMAAEQRGGKTDEKEQNN